MIQKPIEIFPSEFDGRRVLHVDAALLTHTGKIVGMSKDGERFYVQSDASGAPDTSWHFVVNKSILPALLENAEKQG